MKFAMEQGKNGGQTSDKSGGLTSVFTVFNFCVPVLRAMSAHAGQACKTGIRIFLIFLFIFGIFPPSVSADIYSNLIGYWKFNEMTGTTARDSSGNNRTGTLTGSGGPNWVSGNREGALQFNPSWNSYVAVPDSDDSKYTGPLTLSAWVYVVTAGTNISFMSKHSSNGASNNPFDFRTTPSAAKLALVRAKAGSAFCEYTANGSTLSLNGWHHVAVTVSNGNTETYPIFYINGVSVGTVTRGACIGGPATGSGHDIWIGRRDDATQEMNGYMDEVRIYNRALSATDIVQLYNFRSPTMRRPQNNLGLVGYWPMNEGTSTVAGDFSGNGYNGTFTLNPSWIGGKYGRALNFDGTTQAVSTSLTNINFSSGSLSWWQKPSTAYNSGAIRAMWGQSTSGNTTPEFSCQVYTDNNWYCGWNGASDGRVVVAASATNYPQNTWSYYTLVWDTSDTTLYMNGSPIGNSGISPSVSDINDTFQIGRQGSNRTVYFPGSMDDLRIYNRKLLPAEIVALYKKGGVTVGGNEKLKVTDGLVGHWTFNGNDTNWTSQTEGTAYDRSGLGNNGTFTNMDQFISPTSGKMGQALSFDGVDDYIQTTSSNLQSLANFTISVWIKANTTGSLQNIIWEGNSTANGWGGLGDVELHLSIGKIDMAVTSFDVLNFQLADVPNYQDEWVGDDLFLETPFSDTTSFHHAVVVVDGTNGYLYLDGVLVDTDTSTTISRAAWDTSLRIGRAGASSRYFNGFTDDLRLYNRPLSASEIKQLYNLGSGTILKK